MNNPKSNEEKMMRVLKAWQTLTPDKSFGGMTLPQFEAVIGAALTARKNIGDIENQLTEAINVREAADEVGLAKTQLAINGVLADPTEGPNSSVYEAMGYTRKTERQSGLSRKKTATSKP